MTKLFYCLIGLIFFTTNLTKSQSLRIKVWEATPYYIDTTSSPQYFESTDYVVIHKYYRTNNYFDADYKGKKIFLTGYSMDTENPAFNKFVDKYVFASEIKALTNDVNEIDKSVRKSLIKKYGLRDGNLVANGKIKIGLSAKVVKAILGDPVTINRSVTASGVREQWVYSKDNEKTKYYYFKNNILTSWQD